MKSRVPYLREIAQVMTNFDHSIDSDVAERLKVEDAFSRYPGWNFNGRVWWDGFTGEWQCEVWHYGSPAEVVAAATLEEIMATVCENWGGD